MGLFEPVRRTLSLSLSLLLVLPVKFRIFNEVAMRKTVRFEVVKRATLLREIFLIFALVFAFAFLVGCGSDEKPIFEVEVEVEVPVPLTPEQEKINAILDSPELFEPVVEGTVAAEEAFVLNKAAQVAVLCYHDFHVSKATEMVMPAAKFRDQMRAIKEAGIPVITMADFLAWLREEKNVPDPCILITIDDGWDAVHSIAFPILKEFEFPFTIFLYQDYLNAGGRSLDLDELKELMSNGGEIGCHSVTHTNMADKAERDPAAYREYLQVELGQSKRFLKEVTGVESKVFAYPFGKYNDQAIEVAEDFGYEALFTVNGRRASWYDPRAELGRFVVHGDNDFNFNLATGFRSRDGIEADPSLSTGDAKLPFTTFPAPEERVKERRPEIRVDLSGLDDALPESIEMKVGGFGSLRTDFDPASRTVRCRVPQSMRNPECLVYFSVQVEGESKARSVSWRFYFDKNALYLEKPEETRQLPPAVDEPGMERGVQESV